MRPTLFAVPLLLVVPMAVQRSATVAGGRIEARGACDLRPDALACWDMDGAPSLELASSMRSALGGGSEASFRFGKKNRYLVVRRSLTPYVSYRIGANANAYANLSVGDDPRTEFVHFVAEPGDAVARLEAQVTVPATSDEVLPLQPGTRASIDGWKVEVGTAQKIAEERGATGSSRSYCYNGAPPTGERWTVVLGLTGGNGEYVSWAYTPLDASGAPILYVDPRGKPLTPVRALELEPMLQSANGYRGFQSTVPGGRKPRASAAYFQGNGPVPAFRANTNVDPKWIDRIRIRASHQEMMQLGPFPLDPK